MDAKTLAHNIHVIVRKAQEGDIDAFSKLYENYKRQIFGLCLRMLSDVGKAEDIMHDSFIIAFQRISMLKDEGKFEAWLKRIVVNSCIAQSRIKMPRFVDSFDEDAYIYENNSDEWWINIDICAINNEIMELPDGCREIFNLFVFEDYTHKEIADLLGISESTSKSQYSRAKLLIRQRLKK